MLDEYNDGSYWVQSVGRFEMNLFNKSVVPDLNKFTKPNYITLLAMYEHLDHVLDQSVYYEPIIETDPEISSSNKGS